MQFDGKGVVMIPEALREATAKAAARARRKLRTRLSPGEKNGRKPMAEVAAVYDTLPAPRTPADVITGGQRHDTPPRAEGHRQVADRLGDPRHPQGDRGGLRRGAAA